MYNFYMFMVITRYGPHNLYRWTKYHSSTFMVTKKYNPKMSFETEPTLLIRHFSYRYEIGHSKRIFP